MRKREAQPIYNAHVNMTLRSRRCLWPRRHNNTHEYENYQLKMEFNDLYHAHRATEIEKE